MTQTDTDPNPNNPFPRARIEKNAVAWRRGAGLSWTGGNGFLVAWAGIWAFGRSINLENLLKRPAARSATIEPPAP